MTVKKKNEQKKVLEERERNIKISNMRFELIAIEDDELESLLQTFKQNDGTTAALELINFFAIALDPEQGWVLTPHQTRIQNDFSALLFSRLAFSGDSPSIVLGEAKRRGGQTDLTKPVLQMIMAAAVICKTEEFRTSGHKSPVESAIYAIEEEFPGGEHTVRKAYKTLHKVLIKLEREEIIAIANTTYTEFQEEGN